jgi:hypothetical protein
VRGLGARHGVPGRTVRAPQRARGPRVPGKARLAARLEHRSVRMGPGCPARLAWPHGWGPAACAQGLGARQGWPGRTAGAPQRGCGSQVPGKVGPGARLGHRSVRAGPGCPARRAWAHGWGPAAFAWAPGAQQGAPGRTVGAPQRPRGPQVPSMACLGARLGPRSVRVGPGCPARKSAPPGSPRPGGAVGREPHGGRGQRIATF